MGYLDLYMFDDDLVFLLDVLFYTDAKQVKQIRLQQQQYMQSDQELTISLSDLSSLPQLPSPIAINPFAAYLLDPRKKEEKIQLLSKDTKEFPLKPMRRQACPLCLVKSIPCQKCPQCHPKKKSCCRNLSCIYDHQAYTQNKKAQSYRTCPCIIKDFLPNSDAFQLDWRLLSLIQKLPEAKSAKHKYYLHHAGGSLWISKELPGSFEDGPREIFYEDNFALASFHQRTFRDQNDSSLAESNSRYFSNLLRKNMRRFLATKQGWQVSNLQQECQEIVDSFFSNRKLEAIKGNFQTTSQNAYASETSLKFQGKYTQILVSSSKSEPEYRDCSDAENPDLIFSYSFRNQFLFVRNAKYLQKQEQSSNLRPIRIRWRGEPIGPQGIWFKDRKGDIFAISKGSLFIFKFHIPSKTFQQFPLDNHPLLGTVDSPSTLLYIPHRDTAYYFTAKDLKKSFYFTLYRPKVEQGGKGKNAPLSKLSCTSVTFYPEFLQVKEKLLPKGGVGGCRAIYAMEDYRFKEGKDHRKELVPVIYLLCERKGYLPLGIGLYRLVHHDDSLQAFSQLPAISPQSNSQDPTRNLSFTSGVHFSLRMQKGLRLCYYSVLDNKPTLITGKVLTGSDGKDGVLWDEDYMELTGFFQPKTMPEGMRDAWRPEGYMPITQVSDFKDQKGLNLVPLFITDILGAPGNNEAKFMGENYRTGRVVEILISLVEGMPQWRIFEI